MKIKSIKTKKLIPGQNYDLLNFLDESIKEIKENTILAVASKVVSICQGRLVKKDKAIKEDLITREADLFVVPDKSKHKSIVTIKDSVMQVAAGIDESNAADYYILQPKDAFKTADNIRKYFKDKYQLDNLGVIITDSRSTPLRTGVVGVGLAYSGFRPAKNYVGSKDIFGRKLKISQTNLVDCLASVAILAMGEGDEQTPMALISGLKDLPFNDKSPTKEELSKFNFDYSNDIYWDVIGSVDWARKID